MAESTVLQRCISEAYNQANQKLRLANITRWCAFAATIVALCFTPPSWFPLLVFLFCVPTEFLLLRNETLKHRAEQLKSTHEIADGLGIVPCKIDLANAAAEFLKAPVASEDLLKGLVFASSVPPSPQRVLENLRESAWWSHQGAKIAAQRTFIQILLLVGIAALIPLGLPHFVGTIKSAITGTLFSSSIILAIFSLGVGKRAWGLYQFSVAASRTATQAQELLRGTDAPHERDATFLLHRYQLDRVSSPSIPSSIWSKNREHLNTLYKDQFN